MSSDSEPKPSLKKIKDDVQKSMRSRSTANLVAFTGVSTLRVAHMTNILLRQRNTVYADGRRLTVPDNVGHLIMLSLTTLGLYSAGREAVHRMNGVSLQVPEDSKTLDPADFAMHTAAIGLSLAEVKKGRTFVKKRPLSTYGRVYQTLTNTYGAVQLAMRARAAM